MKVIQWLMRIAFNILLDLAILTQNKDSMGKLRRAKGSMKYYLGE